MKAYKDPRTNMWLIEGLNHEGKRIQAISYSFVKAVAILMRMQHESYIQ